METKLCCLFSNSFTVTRLVNGSSANYFNMASVTKRRYARFGPSRKRADVKKFLLDRPDVTSIPRSSFLRLAKEVASKLNSDLRVGSEAMTMLQRAAEDHLHAVLEMHQEAVDHRGKTVVCEQDIHYVRQLMARTPNAVLSAVPEERPMVTRREPERRRGSRRASVMSRFLQRGPSDA